jgi:hypothetical protein
MGKMNGKFFLSSHPTDFVIVLVKRYELTIVKPK